MYTRIETFYATQCSLFLPSYLYCSCMVCQHTTVTNSKKVKETIPRGCHDDLSIFGVVELSFKRFKDGFRTLKGLCHGTCCFPVKTVQKSFFLTLTQAENIVLIFRAKKSINILQKE